MSSRIDTLTGLTAKLALKMDEVEHRLKQLEQAVPRSHDTAVGGSGQLDWQKGSDLSAAKSAAAGIGDLLSNAEARAANAEAHRPMRQPPPLPGERVSNGKNAQNRDAATRSTISESADARTSPIDNGGEPVEPTAQEDGSTAESHQSQYAESHSSHPQEPSCNTNPENAEQAEQAEGPIGLEAKIGSFWLNRIGLLALLIGVVSLLLYSFQYFGAPIKICFGFALGASLVCAGRSKTINAKPWFAQGLNALGWSIAYFTGYAMHFVPSLRVIESAPLEMVLLSALSAATMLDAIRAKSEFTATLSTTFGALSICTATLSANPMGALLVLTAAAAFVAVRQSWYLLLLYTTAAFYLAFNLVASSLHIPEAPFYLSLITGWLSIHAAVFFAQSSEGKTREQIVLVSVVNALIAYGSIGLMNVRLGTNDLLLGFMTPSFIMGSIYLITARLFKRKGDDDLWTLHLLLGLSFVNISKWAKITGLSAATADVIQCGLLAIIGLRFNIKAFRWFAAFLSMAIIPEVTSNGWAIGTLAATVYGYLGYAYRHSDMSKFFAGSQRVAHSNFYITLAHVAGALVIGNLSVDMDWKAPLWTLQLIASAYFGLKSKNGYLQALSVTLGLCLLPFLGYLVMDPFANHWQSVMGAASLFYTYAWYCRIQHKEFGEKIAVIQKELFYFAATALVTVQLLHYARPHVVAIAVGIEGLVLITAGFLAKEKYLRIFGLTAFGITAIHLLFVDFASAPTITRIISFIVTGLILVGCSYCYAWFSKRIA